MKTEDTTLQFLSTKKLNKAIKLYEAESEKNYELKKVIWKRLEDLRIEKNRRDMKHLMGTCYKNTDMDYKTDVYKLVGINGQRFIAIHVWFQKFKSGDICEIELTSVWKDLDDMKRIKPSTFDKALRLARQHIASKLKTATKGYRRNRR